MKVITRPSQQNRYECSSCGTNFSLADLEFDCQHKITSKYRVCPDVKECPFCGVSLDERRMDTQVLELKKIGQRGPNDRPNLLTNHYPTTVNQNCHSGNHTIQPQINWVEFDKEYGHLITKC